MQVMPISASGALSNYLKGKFAAIHPATDQGAYFQMLMENSAHSETVMTQTLRSALHPSYNVQSLTMSPAAYAQASYTQHQLSYYI